MPIMLTLVALLLLAWGGYWYTAYSLANGFISDASAAAPSDNIAFGCGDRRLGGFPLQLTVDCQSFISTNGPAMRASLGGVAATAPLYNPGRVQADIVGPFEVVGEGYAIRSNWRGGQCRLHRWSRWRPRRDRGLLVARFRGFKTLLAKRNGRRMRLPGRPKFGRRPASSRRYMSSFSAADLIIAFGGDAFPEMSGTANLTVLGAGNRIDGDPARILGRWLDAGGDFQIDFLTVTSGDVLAEITGPMSLGRNGSLTGRVMVRYVGQEDLPTLVAAIFPWYADDAETIAEAIRALSREIEMRGRACA